jgi:hypothetical protein
MPRRAPITREWFLGRVEQGPECWIWKGAYLPDGTPMCHHTTALRMAHHLFVGPVEPGQPVRHRCETKGCVRPEHLILSGTPEYFWLHVERGEGCWHWTGPVQDGKRPNVGFRKGMKIAARVAYELTHGEIPAGLNVCHHCDDGLCVRPDHLFLGTQADNIADMMAKGRGRARQRALSPETERAVRDGYEGRPGELSALARKHGVSPQTITRVLRRKAAA